MRIVCMTGMGLLSLLLAVPALGAGDDEEVARQLFAEILAPVSEAAQSVSAGGIAVRGQPGSAGPEQRFFDAVGDHLLDQGFDVWVMDVGEPVPLGVLALDMELTTSEIDYPTQSRQFMGIGRARVQRRVALGAHLRLTDPAVGRVLYNAEPVRVHREWMTYTQANENAERRPDWMGAAAIQDMQPRNPWWQRTLVLGIAAGVAVLYFGGAT
jgi:hypothetical protein